MADLPRSLDFGEGAGRLESGCSPGADRSGDQRSSEGEHGGRGDGGQADVRGEAYGDGGGVAGSAAFGDGGRQKVALQPAA